jgi:hypothetical protein
MTPNRELELFLVVLFVLIIAIGMAGVVMLIAGTYGAVVLAGKIEGIQWIGTAVCGLALCGMSAVLFALLWPDDKSRSAK